MDKRILEMCREIDAAKLATAQEGVTAWAEKLQDELLAEKEWVKQLTKTTARLEKFLVNAQKDAVRYQWLNTARLEKFLVNAQKDAVRYRWLKARPVEDCTTPRIEVNVWTVSDSVNEGDHPRQCAWPLSVLAGDALDAAIDAAMKGNT